MLFIKRNKWILIILLVAAFLRFYNLGFSSFWFDEANVAFAATQPTLSQAVKATHLSVASMPLDYIILWFMARFSQAEGWLRIPEALWGIAAVGILFLFARQVAGRTIAHLSALFLALAQVHIYFSQELRFYAPLFFFYWLNTWLFFRAQKEPSRRNWILVIEAAIIGAYIHFYTLFAFFNGLVFILLFSRWRTTWKVFFISAMITGLCVLPGFLIFGLSTPMPDLSMFANPLLPELSKALGWSSITGNLAGNILGAVFLFLALTGLVAAILRRRWVLVGLTASIAVQIGILVVMDVLARYFFVTRTFLFALPITFLLAGYALQTLVHAPEGPQLSSFHISITRPLAGFILAGLVGLSLLTYIQNQPIQKSNAHPISAYLHEAWQPGDQVWVNPAYDPFTFLFYLDVYFKDDRMIDIMKGYSWSDLPNPGETRDKIFLITQRLGPEDVKSLEIRGFERIQDLSGPSWLWVRSAS